MLTALHMSVSPGMQPSNPMPFHPSPRLNFYFGRRPYQGADPSNAQHIFIGEDANFAPDIEE